MKSEKDDTSAPKAASYSCTCGSVFSTAGDLMGHTNHCKIVTLVNKMDKIVERQRRK